MGRGTEDRRRGHESALRARPVQTGRDAERAEKNPLHNLERLQWLKALGFKASEKTWFCRSADELIEAIAELDKRRHSFAYDTDGAVIKLNSLELQRKAGATSKAPRWA